jgi:hypothetical protein
MTTVAVIARSRLRTVFGTAENGRPILCFARSADVGGIHVYGFEEACGFIKVRLSLRIRESTYEGHVHPSVWPLSASGPFVEFL